MPHSEKGKILSAFSKNFKKLNKIQCFTFSENPKYYAEVTCLIIINICIA